MASPVQIILNPENFHERRIKSGGGSDYDFFADRDQEFAQHKYFLIFRLRETANSLVSSKVTDIGYVKVTMRRKAWAKSHRPVKVLFKHRRTPAVGGGNLGVMIIEAFPATLLQVADEIEGAEKSTRWRFDEAKRKWVPDPSRARSDTGAIDSIELFSASDRRNFSLKDALDWLSNPATGGNYEVDLFVSLPSPSAMDTLGESRRRMFMSFSKGLEALSRGLTVERRNMPVRSPARLSVRIHQASSPPISRLGADETPAGRRDIAPFDTSEKPHRQLLEFLDRHPLVRRISLPGVVVQSNDMPAHASSESQDSTARPARRLS